MTKQSLRMVVADVGQAYDPERDYSAPLDLNMEIELVEPFFALRWIARRSFTSSGTERAVRKWHECLASDMAKEGAREEGALDVAERVLGDAVARGDVRCAFVVPSDFSDWNGDPLPRLEMLDVRQLGQRGWVVHFSTQDGFALLVDVGTPEAMCELTDFYFLWDDVARLWPGEPETLSEPAARPALRADPPAPLSLPAAPQVRSERGRRSKPYGRALAAVIRRAHAFGIEKAASQQNIILGEWLQDEYRRLGVYPVPKAAEAGSDAKAVIEAILEITREVT